MADTGQTARARHESPFPIRQECRRAPVCDRDRLLADPAADIRVLRLTKEEEKRLIARLENPGQPGRPAPHAGALAGAAGHRGRILPSDNEVRTTRGIFIQLDEQPGLCRKTRSAIPAAIRRSFDNRPEIVYALLNERDLLAGA